jgi:peroxiredoxin
MAAQAAVPSPPELSPYDPDRVRAGAPAPDFVSRTLDGKEVRLSDYRGRHVVLVFYRGHW